MTSYKYFRTTEEIVAHAKPLQSLIHPSFVLGSLTLIVGDAGTCKTTLVAGLSNAVVKGEEFLGFVPVENPIRVAIFDLESSESLIRERYLEVLQERPMPGIWTCNEPVTWKEAQDELMELVRREKVNLVFLDHLFLAFPQEDMGSASEAIKMMLEQRAFAKTFNVCVVSLLHPPLEQRVGIRKGFGSIYKTNSVDVQINLTPDFILRDIVELEVVKDRCYNQYPHFKFRKEGGKFVVIEDLTQQPEAFLNKTEACRETILSFAANEAWEKEQPTSLFTTRLGRVFKENMIKVELSHLAERGLILRPKHGFYKAVKSD